tara:strand:- start:917 stop:1054 length:138 start_codon:yes stop_codon:yes gene_type:complete
MNDDCPISSALAALERTRQASADLLAAIQAEMAARKQEPVCKAQA